MAVCFVASSLWTTVSLTWYVLWRSLLLQDIAASTALWCDIFRDISSWQYAITCVCNVGKNLLETLRILWQSSDCTIWVHQICVANSMKLLLHKAAHNCILSLRAVSLEIQFTSTMPVLNYMSSISHQTAEDWQREDGTFLMHWSDPTRRMWYQSLQHCFLCNIASGETNLWHLAECSVQ